MIAAAKKYKCVACLKHKKPNQVAPSSMPQPKTFNEVIQADVFYLKPADRKFAVLSIVDVGTKFMAAYLLHEETSKSYITALEKMWVRHFGPPKKLISDEGRPWLGAPFESWTSSLGIDHQVAPGEAHERLSLVERRHAVLRRACEVYMGDRKLNDAAGIKEALCYVIPQQNATPAVAGFSPSKLASNLSCPTSWTPTSMQLNLLATTAHLRRTLSGELLQRWHWHLLMLTPSCDELSVASTRARIEFSSWEKEYGFGVMLAKEP